MLTLPIAHAQTYTFQGNYTQPGKRVSGKRQAIAENPNNHNRSGSVSLYWCDCRGCRRFNCNRNRSGINYTSLTCPCRVVCVCMCECIYASVCPRFCGCPLLYTVVFDSKTTGTYSHDAIAMPEPTAVMVRWALCTRVRVYDRYYAK